jgi:hypothetical protein
VWRKRSIHIAVLLFVTTLPTNLVLSSVPINTIFYFESLGSSLDTEPIFIRLLQSARAQESDEEEQERKRVTRKQKKIMMKERATWIKQMNQTKKVIQVKKQIFLNWYI